MATAQSDYVLVEFLRDWYLMRQHQRQLVTWGQADILTKRGFCRIVEDGTDSAEVEATNATDKRADQLATSQASTEHRQRRRYAR